MSFTPAMAGSFLAHRFRTLRVMRTAMRLSFCRSFFNQQRRSMISSVTPQSIRDLDKEPSRQIVEERLTPAFTRQAASAGSGRNTIASRTFGKPQGLLPSNSGFVRQTQVQAGHKDGTPGVLEDIASQTWNSGVEFSRAGSQWAAHQVPTQQQLRHGASLALHAAGGALYGGLIAGGLNRLSNSYLSNEHPFAMQALIGAGAAIGTGISWLNLPAPVAPALRNDFAHIAG